MIHPRHKTTQTRLRTELHAFRFGSSDTRMVSNG